METAGLIIATILGSGGFAVIVVKWMERRKTGAEARNLDANANMTDAQATDILVSAGERAVNLMQKQLERAMDRIEKLERNNSEKDIIIHDLRRDIEGLHKQIAQLERRKNL